MSKMGVVAMELDDLDRSVEDAARLINEREVILPPTDEKTDIAKDKVENENNTKKTTSNATSKPVETPHPVVTKPQSQSEFEVFRTYVNGSKLAVDRGDGKIYLRAEAWLYLAKIKGVTPHCASTERYDGNGDLVSVKVECRLFDELGTEISRSDMIASKNEVFLKNLDDFAVYGMAQTRAISRAIRDVYGYVARGAGFEATPAEEVGL